MNATAPNRDAPLAGEDEVCAVCGRALGAAPFCHIYRDGRTITLCDPTCAELFLHRGDSDSEEPSPWNSVYASADRPGAAGAGLSRGG